MTRRWNTCPPEYLFVETLAAGRPSLNDLPLTAESTKAANRTVARRQTIAPQAMAELASRRRIGAASPERRHARNRGFRWYIEWADRVTLVTPSAGDLLHSSWGMDTGALMSAGKFREFAAEHLDWARTATSDKERETFEQMARAWLEVAAVWESAAAGQGGSLDIV
jgi:hypothetical protein